MMPRYLSYRHSRSTTLMAEANSRFVHTIKGYSMLMLTFGISVSAMIAMMIWTLDTENDAEKRRLQGS